MSGELGRDPRKSAQIRRSLARSRELRPEPWTSGRLREIRSDFRGSRAAVQGSGAMSGDLARLPGICADVWLNRMRSAQRTLPVPSTIPPHDHERPPDPQPRRGGDPRGLDAAARGRAAAGAPPARGRGALPRRPDRLRRPARGAAAPVRRAARGRAARRPGRHSGSGFRRSPYPSALGRHPRGGVRGAPRRQDATRRSRRPAAASSRPWRSTRRASEEELVANVRRRMDQMLAWGTTTAEAKSGYGLTRDGRAEAAPRHPPGLRRAPGGPGADAPRRPRGAARATGRTAGATST